MDDDLDMEAYKLLIDPTPPTARDSRPASKMKPNTRFLSHIVREAKSHNAALLAREAADAQRRLKRLDRKGGREDNSSSDNEWRKRRRHGTDDSARDDDRRRRRRRRGDGDAGRDDRERDGERRDTHSSNHRHRRSHHHDSSREDRERDREKMDRDRHSKSRRHRDTEDGHAEMAHDSSNHKHRRERSKSPRLRSRRRSASPRPSKHNHDHRDRDRSPYDSSDRDQSDYSSDPLDDFVGPQPASSLDHLKDDRNDAGIRIRGRGVHSAVTRGFAASSMDRHFAANYDPSKDVEHPLPASPPKVAPRPASIVTEDAEAEMQKDRKQLLRDNTERLKAAGFTDREIAIMSRGGRRRLDSSPWAKKGEAREWDRDKVAGQEGPAKPAWAR
ncbi:hypothetical protein SPBR_05086 [Sporothrix brasiliensis 5110]|uniref:Pre-mRNA-splicing factor 38B n=1 Tax=Sporothrix brasiliensis 5110 TaxID=1398154 RepID=A0A0C2IRC5_9PEZI|nr:uncharacterized protein SPBR_05086 [Sporothrix brasiliensis 5110]KIH87567.1 hypothetical protein SPBR_05086 [Sporothrix brasiliensis 5110]